MSEKPCGAYFFAFFENFFVPILTSGGLAAVSASAFAALYSAFGKYDVVHIHAEGPAFFSWLPKMFGKRVVVTIHGVDWQREKWQSGFGSKFIRQGEKNAVRYADEIIVLSKGVQDYFKETYDRETHFIPNGVNAYSKLYNIPSTGLRFFTVYGPAGRPDMAYFGFTNKLVKGETIKIFNYGNCKRDFTYVDDIVEGVVRVMKKAPDKKNGEDGLPIPPYAVYNIGNQNPENLLDFVQILSWY